MPGLFDLDDKRGHYSPLNNNDQNTQKGERPATFPSLPSLTFKPSNISKLFRSDTASDTASKDTKPLLGNYSPRK